MSEDTITILKRIVTVANASAPSVPTQDHAATAIPDFPPFASPQPIASRLISLGLPHNTAEQMSAAYMVQAEELRKRTESVTRSACSRLVSPCSGMMSMPLDVLQRRVFDTYHAKYRSTLSSWEKEAQELASSRLAAHSTNPAIPSARQISQQSSKKFKRQFKSEYLPLFEFAFEKDRFPSREDKKHLARISSMSYRQVCVWFQNRRCRQASRVKTRCITPVPKTLEEMKDRLPCSAPKALLKPLPLTKKLNPDTADRAASEEPVLAQDTPKTSLVPEIIILDDAPSPGSSTRAASWETTDGATSPASSRRAVSLEASDDGYASDECDELADDDFSETPVYQRPSFIEEPTPIPQNSNPLNPPKTSAQAFPAAYEPSRLTSDPFVVGHYPWLRDRRTASRKFIDPTPEAMEDIMGGFDRMDVDEPNAMTTNEPLSRLSIQRNVSSGSIGMWSSGESTAASHASSYSSSAQSSPRISVAELPTSSEGTLEAEVDAPSECTLEVSDYAASSEAEDRSDVDTEAETVCDSPEEESMTAGPSAASLKNQVTPTWESSAEERVDAWALESGPLHTNPPATNLRWENLLAVAAQATL